MKEELNVDSEKTLADTNLSKTDVLQRELEHINNFFDETSNKILTERIMHLRRLLLVHSYLYYVLDDPIVPDDLWQQWANELVDINQDVGYYDEAFKDWDGTTGYHLPFEDRWVISKSLQIRRINEKYKGDI